MAYYARAEAADATVDGKRLSWTVADSQITEPALQTRSSVAKILYPLPTSTSRVRSTGSFSRDEVVVDDEVFVGAESDNVSPNLSSTLSRLSISDDGEQASGVSVQLPAFVPINVPPVAVPGALPVNEDEDLDMAEDKALAPPLFKGTSSENGEDWYRHFEHYCSYKEMPEAKKLALFKVLMTDLAGDWLASLPADNTNTYAALELAFDARYKVPEM